ncbi:SPOR domain-containing protein [Shimia sp.]|uniref:SPOR domain-containing protein n=1 Tax=Shimia sp. TaxID=1954381 RepID=UPI003B8DD3E6
MKLSRFLAVGVIAASFGLGAAHAQSIGGKQTPAEFPPASFNGKQFVDSRGCVYIRAGVDGATTWVPRVTRDRKVICGFKPTFDASTTTTAAAPKLDKNVVQIQPAAPETNSVSGAAAATVAPAAKTKATAPKTTTAKKVVKQPKGAPLYTTPTAARPSTTAKTTAAPKVIAPAAAPVATPKTKAVAPAVTTTTAPAVRRTTTQTPRNSGIVSPCRQGITTYKGSKVRCGPQAQSPVTPGTGRPTAQPPQMRFDRNSSLRRPPVGTVVRVGEVAPDVRVVPRHVYEANLASQGTFQVPEGYRRAFDDGRLDENRAVMTLAGEAQTRLIWTDTVPRRLIERTLETEDVVARNTTVTSVAESAPKTNVSTKSEPVVKSLRLAGTPYVQVGTYTDAAKAQAVAKDIRRLGLPVRIGKFSRDGQTQRLVLAGPFSEEDVAKVALSKAQGAGFSGAFLRK